MKKTIINIVYLFTLLLMVNCQEERLAFGSLGSPTNLEVKFDLIGKTADAPNGDGSGKVKFTATASDAISFKFVFPDGTSTSGTSGVFEKRFTKVGLNTYSVIVLASGKGGITTNTTIDVEVLSTFEDVNAVTFLTGNNASGVKWYWAQSEQDHLGVGQNSPDAKDKNGHLNYYPTYYGAKPNEKSSTCLYNSVMTFSLVGSQIKFNLDNKGQTFYNGSYQGGGQDNCYDLDTSGLKTVTLSPSESYVSMNADHATQTTGTMINISDGGFMGYFIGTSSYEILSITANRMVVRAVMGNNPALAWYHTFTTSPPGVEPPPSTDYTNLVWSDTFDVDGAPDSAKWGYDLGAGGWGNNEAQTYTNSSTNVIVQGGILKITAKKDGSGYTSTRLKTQGIYDLKYGKIEVKAKLPSGSGTWPAIWMLGSDITTNSWPACGEIDIMEHKGTTPNVIYGSLHYPDHSGGNSITKTKTIANASTEFHIYKAIWNSSSIKFYVDDVLYHDFTNSSTLPFNKKFFLLLNVAMGGDFGGAIDPLFTQSTMEVDYVKVYQ